MLCVNTILYGTISCLAQKLAISVQRKTSFILFLKCCDEFHYASVSLEFFLNLWTLEWNLSMALMLLTQTICLGGLKEILQRQTQLGSSVWSQSFPCWPYFARTLPLLTKFFSSELQIARWRMTFQSRQQHTGNSQGWSVGRRGLFQELESCMVIAGSWRDCKNRNGAYLWRHRYTASICTHSVSVKTTTLGRQWVTA